METYVCLAVSLDIQSCRGAVCVHLIAYMEWIGHWTCRNKAVVVLPNLSFFPSQELLEVLPMVISRGVLGHTNT